VIWHRILLIGLRPGDCTHGAAVRTVRPCAAAPGHTGRTSATSKAWVRDVEGLPAAPATAAFRGHHNSNRRAVRKSPRLAARVRRGKTPGARGPDAGRRTPPRD